MAAGRARGSRQRRVSLPGVAELLRPVGPGPASDSGRQASGREAHSQKITVYLSADELLDLERARLTLRAHGIGVDRGRLVREAIAVLMMDLEAGIDASMIARRLGAPGRPDPAGPAPVPPGGVLTNGVLASGAHGALATAAFANGSPASGGPHNGTLVDGALTGGALGNDGPVTGARANGAPGDGGPLDGAVVNSVLTGGAPGNDGPVSGELAGGGLVAGAPAGAQ